MAHDAIIGADCSGLFDRRGTMSLSFTSGGARKEKQDFLSCMLEMEELLRYAQPAYYMGGFPVLSSIVPVLGSLRYIFNLKGERGDFYDRWANTKLWTCSNENNVSQAVRFEGLDPHRHTLIIDCNGALKVKYPEKRMYQSYPIHKGCQMLDDRAEDHHHLALCTMVKGPNLRQEITEWVAYHSLVGIERFFIYVNDPFDDYMQFALPNVTFIPFEHGINKAFFFQQAMQNDCIQRTRDRVDWVGLNDLDEYFYFVGGENKSTPLDYFNQQKSRNISAIQARNIFWGSNNGTNDDRATTNLTLDKYCWREPQPSRRREKVWLQPNEVQYISIHAITLGGLQIKADPSDLLNAHFKRPHKGVFESRHIENTYDESLRNGFAHDMSRWITENT